MGASAFHLPTLRSFGDLTLLAEMLHSLHKGAKAGPEPGPSRVDRKWQLPPSIVQIRSPRLREGSGIQDHQLEPAQGIGPRVGLRSACLRATVVLSAHRAYRSAQTGTLGQLSGREWSSAHTAAHIMAASGSHCRVLTHPWSPRSLSSGTQ